MQPHCASAMPASSQIVRRTREGRRRMEQPRLLTLVQLLENDSELRQRVQHSLGEMLAQLDFLSLFAETGLPSVHSFTTEIIQRLTAKLVPSAREDSDARKLMIDLYSSERNAKQFAALSSEIFERIVSVLAPTDAPEFWQRQERDLEEAMRLLAARISGLGLQSEMRERSTASGIAHSPFYELVHTSEELLAPSSPEAAPAALDAWKQVVARCRAEMEVVYEHMESAGISVELVFDLKTIQACLVRMEAIAKVLTATEPHELLAAVQALLDRLIEGNISDKQISSLLRENLNLLARKVVDRTGDTGEHYIANSKPEYWLMWRAAIGGGLLTVFTAAVKLRIIEAHLPPFVEGFASGTNYAVSFVLLQVFGLVLATKQPATTAAAFARIIRDHRGRQRSSKLTDFVARITSTQLAAAIGNVVAVSAGAVLFEMLWRVIFRESYLPELSATHVYDTLNPFASGTALYAIETGVILWLAALAGSWIENAAVYYRLAEALAQHPRRLTARRGIFPEDVAHRQTQHWRLGYQHRTGISAGLHAGPGRVLRTAARCAARDAVQRHAGFGGGAFWHRQPGRPMVLSRGGRNRRDLCAQPVRELHDRGICGLARLRCWSTRAVEHSPLPGYRRAQIATALYCTGV